MALPHLKEYHSPSDMSGALALLQRRNVRTAPLAGGTYFTAYPDPTIEAVVDLSHLGLDRICVEEMGVRLGSMVRLESLLLSASLLGRAGQLINEAVRRVPSCQLRQAATLGGSLIVGAVPDLEAILLSLDARVSLLGNNVRTLDFEAFLEERTRLPQGTLVAEVLLPKSCPSAGIGTARVSRTPNDMSIISAVAFVSRQGDLCSALRLVVTGVISRPIRLLVVEQTLVDQVWMPATIERAVEHTMASISPISDFRGSSAYRRAMVGVCTRRAFSSAWEDAAD